jgi:putative ABC transport system permease protein
VAQRAREFALLRTLGASRGQVLRSVLSEGLVLGILGSIAGLALGILVATGLRELFKAVGFELPSGDSVIATRTIVVSMVVGIVVTLVSTLSPALRATRVPPVAALREGVALPETRSSRWALPFAVVLTALGVVLMAIGLFVASGESAALLARRRRRGADLPRGGAPVAQARRPRSPRCRPPDRAPCRASPGRWRGRTPSASPGARRDRRALMIGVALVAFATIFTAGFRDTIDDSIDGGITGQAIIQSQDGFTPVRRHATPARARRPAGGRRSARCASPTPAVQGEDSSVTGVEPGDARPGLRPRRLRADPGGRRRVGGLREGQGPRGGRRADRRHPPRAGAPARDRPRGGHRRHRLRRRPGGQRAARA